MDVKTLSLLLTSRLEKITKDQTGFTKGPNSGNTVRRLLNAIQFCQQKKVEGLVVSLDEEKAFNRVEGPHLFITLEILIWTIILLNGLRFFTHILRQQF